MTEHEIQKLSVAALRKTSFTCIVTSNRKKTSNTKGCPDVFVYVRRGLWIALEFKQPKGKMSLEQATLNESGSSYIVDSIGGALQVCMKYRNVEHSADRADRIRKISEYVKQRY
jgi:hypothetical protein